MPSDQPAKRCKPKSEPIEVILLARLWIKNIMEWTTGKSEKDFSGSSLLQSGAHRALMAAGEAFKDVPDAILSSESAIPWEDIKGLRNILAHDYWDGIEKKIVWLIVTKELRPLDAAPARLEQRLQQNPEP